MLVRLYSLLRLTFDNYNNKGIHIDIENQITIRELFDLMNIDPEGVQMVFVNDKYIKDLNYFIENKDSIKIFPHFPAGG